MEGQQQAALQVSAGDEMASNISTCHMQRGLDCEQDENNSRQKSNEDWSCNVMQGASIQPPGCAWSWDPSHAGGINQHYQSEWSWSPVSSFQRRYAGRWSWSPTQLKILPYSTQGENSAPSTPSESPATTVNCWPIFVNTCRLKRKRKRCRKRGRALKYRPYNSKGERKWGHLTSITELVQGTETKNLMFQDETMSARHVSHDIKHRTFTSCATEMKFLNSQARKHSGLLYTREGIVGEIEKSSNTASTVDGMLGKIASPRSEAEAKGNIKLYSKNNENIQSVSPHSEGRRLVLGSHDEIIGATENSVSAIQVHEVVKLPTENQYPLAEFDNTDKLHEEMTMPPSKMNEANEAETESTLPISEVHMTKTAQINNIFVPKIRGTEVQKVRLLEMNEVNDGRTKPSSPKLKIEEIGNIQTDRSTPYDTDEKIEVQGESSCHLSSPRRDDVMPTDQPLDSPSQASQNGKSQGKEILWTEKNQTLLLNTNATTSDEVTEHLFSDREIAKGGTHSPSPAIAFERTRHGRCSRSPSPVDKLISGGIERSFSLELPQVPGAVAMSAEGFCEAKHLQSTTSSWPQDMLTILPRKTYEFQSSNDNSQSESLLSLMDSVKSGNRTSLSPEKYLSENPSCKHNIATQVCGVLLPEKNVTGDSTVNTFHLTGDGGMVMSVRKKSVNSFPNQTVQGSSSSWRISTTIEGETGECQDARETAEDCTPQGTLRRTRTLILPSPLIYSDSNISMINRTESLDPVYERLDYKDNEKRKSFVVDELELVSTRSDASSASNGENMGILQKDPHLNIGPKYTSEGKSHQEVMVNYNEGLSVKYNVSESQAQIQEKNTSFVQTGITRPSELILSSHKRDKCFSLEGISGRPKSPSPGDEPSLQRSSSPSLAEEPSLQGSRSPSPAEEPRQGSRSPSPANEPYVQGFSSPSPAEKPRQRSTSPSLAERPSLLVSGIPSPSEDPSVLGFRNPLISEEPLLQGPISPSTAEEPSLQGFRSPSPAEEPRQGFSSPSPAEEPRQGFRSLSPAEEPSLKGFSSTFPAEKGFRSLSPAEKSFLQGSRSPSPAEKHRQGFRNPSLAEKPSLQRSSSPSPAEKPQQRFRSPSPAEEPSLQGFRSPSLIKEFSLHGSSSTFSAEEPFLQGSRSPSHAEEPQQGSRSPSLVERPRQGSISPSPAEELQQISCSPSPAEEPLLQGSSTPSPAEEPRQGFGSLTVAKKHSLQGSSTPSSAEEPRQGFRSSPLAEQLSPEGSSSSFPAGELQQGSRSPSSAEGSSLQGCSSPSLAEESQQGFRSLSPAEDLSLQGSRSSSLSEEPRQGSSGPSPSEESSLQRSSTPFLGEEPSLQVSSGPFSAEEPRQRSISSFPAEELRQVSSSSSFAEESSLQGSSTPSSAEEPRQGFRSSSVAEEPSLQGFNSLSPAEELRQGFRSTSLAEQPSLQGFNSSFPAEELRQGTRSPSSAEVPSLQESSSPSLAEESRQGFESSSPAEEHSRQGSRSPSSAGEPRQGSRSPSPAEEPLLQGPKSVSRAGEPPLQRSTSPSPPDEPQQVSKNPFPDEEPSLQGSGSPSPVDELSLQRSNSPSPAEESSLQESRSPSPAEEPSLHGSRSASPVEEPSRREFNCPYLFEGRSPPVPTSPRSLGYTDSVAGDGNVAFPLGYEASGVTGTQLAWCSFPAVLKQVSPLPQGETDNEPAYTASFSKTRDTTTLFVNEYSCDRGASGVKRKRSADFAADCEQWKKPAADQVDILKNILTEILEAQTSQRGAHRLRMVTRAVSRRLARRSPNHNLQHVAAARMEIFDAVESGNFEGMRELLQDTGPGVRHGNTHCTLLHAAVERQQVDMVLFLLKVISPNVVNKDGRTPAHLAARNGHTQVLRLLLTDPQIDPDKRDNSNKTYQQWLALPLLEAVLEDNRGKVQELLRLGADPDCAVESLSEGHAARELHVTTARQLAHALHHDALLPLLKRKRVEDDSEDDEPGVSTQIMMLRREHRGREKEIKLCVDVSPVEICENDVYKMEAAPRGYVCLLSYVSFKGRPDLHLEGSETDGHNLANIFSKMGYNGHAHFSLTAKQTRQQLAALRDNKMLEQAGCAIFVISSHGSSRRHFLTSDMQTIDIQWMLDFFKDSQCPSLKNKPKIFIWNLCRGHLQEESSRGGSQGGVCGRVDEPLRDVMCLEANSGSFSWHSFSEDGTPFIGALCRTLARHAATKELTQLYRDFLQEYAHVAPDAVPQLTNHGFNKRFYFNPDIKNCTSGNS